MSSKNTNYLLIIFVFVSIKFYGQKGENTHMHLSYKEQLVNRSEGIGVLKEDLRLLPDIDFSLERTFQSKDFTIHDRYSQYFKGMKVIGSSVVVHSKNGIVSSITGTLAENLVNLSHKAEINKEIALQVAAEMMRLELENKGKQIRGSISPKIESIELCVIDKNFPKYSKNYVLAYEVIQTLHIWNTPTKMVHYINATDGNPIFSLDMILEHNIKGTGTSNYYGAVEFDHDSISPTQYRLMDMSRGQGIFVNDRKTGDIFVNSSSDWQYENKNQRAGIDLIYGSQKFYDMMLEKFNFNSLDNQGFPLVANVNYFPYANAFWNGKSTTYGGGDCRTFNSMTALDIVGHEYAHGFTQFNSGLIYASESGALNESMSDIFGKALEYYADSTNFSWLIGRKVAKNINGIIRSMKDPHRKNHPKLYKGRHWSPRDSDVHTNSSVMNHWFYLLVEGENGKNEIGVEYDVKSIGLNNALDIAFMLNTAYLTPTSNYDNAYEYSKIIANELYGENSDEYNSVIEAWKAVGIPYVNNEEEKLKFNFAINGSTDLNPFDCRDENFKFNFSFINESNIVVPANNEVKIKIIGETKKDGVTDLITIFDESIYLEKEIKLGESLDFEANLDIDHELVFVSFRAEISTEFNDIDYFSSFLRSFKFVDFTTQPDLYFECRSIGVSLEDICNPKSKISLVRPFVVHNLCENNQYVFRYDFRDDVHLETYFDTTNVFKRRDNNFAFTQLRDLDLSLFASIKDIIIDVSVIINETDYYLASDTLYRRFPDFITDKEVVTLDNYYNVSEVTDLEVSLCLGCNTILGNDNLLILNRSSRAQINDCASIEDYYTNDVRLNTIFDVSRLTGCYDTENMSEPYLSFDLSMKTYQAYSNSDFRHGIMVYENEILKTSPAITNTGQSFRQIEMPLSKARNGNLKWYIHLQDAEAIIDNIKIYDRAISNTHNLLVDLPYFINNPASDVIYLMWKDVLPADTYISWYNSSGQNILFSEINSERMSMNCSSWSNGVYFYKIKGNNFTYQGKVVVLN